MNPISNHIARAAARYRRRATKQAIAGVITLLLFPLSATPGIAEKMPDVPTALSHAVLGTAGIFLILSILSFAEGVRLDRLRDRYNRPAAPPIQF